MKTPFTTRVSPVILTRMRQLCRKVGMTQGAFVEQAIVAWLEDEHWQKMLKKTGNGDDSEDSDG